MKIILFSDLHAYRHLGYDMFVDTAVQFLNYVAEYAIKNKINTMFFLGDCFQIKTKVDSMDFIRVREVFKAWKDKFDLYFLIGNHDMPVQDSTTGSIMFAFDEYAHVVSDYTYRDIDNTRFHFVSYRKSDTMPKFTKKKETRNVLMMHQDVRGFKMNSFHTSDIGINMKSLDKFDITFSGHYHFHQKKSNIIYVGAPFQTNFGERDTKKGFVVLDTRTLEWKFKQYRDAPRFKYMLYEKREQENVENCFVKVLMPGNVKNVAPVRYELRQRGALSVDFTTATADLIKEIEFVEDLNKSSIKSLATQFLENIDIPEGLNKKKLVSILDTINDKYMAQKG